MNKKWLAYLFFTPIILLFYNNCSEMLSSEHTLRSTEDTVVPESYIIVPPEEVATDDMYSLGKAQYARSCASCHGDLKLSSKRGATVDRISLGFQAIPMMRNALEGKSLNYEAIAYALNNDEASGSMPPEEITESVQKFSCQYPSNRGLEGYSARRLTLMELKNTIRDLFGESVVDGVESTIGLYPEDQFIESVEEFAPDLNPFLVEVMASIAYDVGELAIAEGAPRTRNLPACLLNQFGNINLDDTNCRDQFIRDLGLKILRRPLTTEQFEIFREILIVDNPLFEYNRHKLSSLIAAMMLTPEFIHQIPQYVSESSGKGLVDSFSLASRISYSVAGTAPDQALLASAASNDLKTLEERKVHAQRLLNSASGRKYIVSTFGQFLKIDQIQSLPSQKYGEYLGVSTNGVVDDLKTETLRFVEHHVFDPKTTFNDLMTSNKAFPVNSNTAKILQTQVSNGVNDPKLSNTGHLGLFLRPLFLMSSANRTSPISRGIQFARNVLCTSIPDPDPDLVDEAVETLQEIDEMTTSSRKITEHITAGPKCQVCHQYINPPGFFMENFGPFGERRTTEAVFDGNGEHVSNLAIDSQVNDFLIDNQPVDLDSSDDFIRSVASSSQGQSCFAEKIFSHLNLRERSTNDDCHLSEMEKLLRDGKSIQEVLIHNAISEDKLWQRTN